MKERIEIEIAAVREGISALESVAGCGGESEAGHYIAKRLNEDLARLIELIRATAPKPEEYCGAERNRPKAFATAAE
jgi:hypothetical protein